MQIAILGRQSKLSLAELESLYGAENITPIGEYAALVAIDEPLPQARLGGTMKSAKLLTRLEKTDLEGAFAYLQSSVPDHLQYLPEGKLQFGVSVYGFKAQKNWLLKQMLTLKKIIKKAGRSVRIIENKSEALEAAQVLYNKLTGLLGWELLIIKDGTDVILGQTTAVQDIDAYAQRDHGRPKRDAYVGMLPPKLAQIMINLGMSNEDREKSSSALKPQPSHLLVLDPFCGTGVVLQEALLMGCHVHGSDLSEKMVDYSRENLQWLTTHYPLLATHYSVETADATTHTWDFSKLQALSPKISVVCETYLGKPLTSLPDTKNLDEIVHEANTIAERFLHNIAPQLEKDTRLCLALPAWYLADRRSRIEDRGKQLSPVSGLQSPVFRHLPVLDHLSDLGYNRLDLVHASQEDLIYHRENQVVARELTILEKV